MANQLPVSIRAKVVSKNLEIDPLGSAKLGLFIKGLEERFYVRFYRFEFDLRVRSYHYITYFEYNCQSLSLSNLENIQNIPILFFC